MYSVNLNPLLTHVDVIIKSNIARQRYARRITRRHVIEQEVGNLWGVNSRLSRDPRFAKRAYSIFFRSRGSSIRIIIFRRMTRSRTCRSCGNAKTSPYAGVERIGLQGCILWHGFNFPAKYTRCVYLANRSVVSIASLAAPRQRHG